METRKVLIFSQDLPKAARRAREGIRLIRRTVLSSSPCRRPHADIAEGGELPSIHPRRYGHVLADTLQPTVPPPGPLLGPSGRLVNIQCTRPHAILYAVRPRCVMPRNGIQRRRAKRIRDFLKMLRLRHDTHGAPGLAGPH